MLHSLAPIVLFAYNRPKHTKATLEALGRNSLAAKSDLYIFLDVPIKTCKSHSILKRYLIMFASRSDSFKSIKLCIRPCNFGLSDNITKGLDAIFRFSTKAIILEDDILTSPAFLDYMNNALIHYESESKVWSINGWALPLDYSSIGETFFSREINCWGWATWKDRWQKYKKDALYFLSTFTQAEIRAFNLDDSIDYFEQIRLNAKGKINTWFIFNYASAFKNNALALCPSISYVCNIGFDNTGVHCNSEQKAFFSSELLNNKSIISYPNSIQENTKALELTKNAYKSFYSSTLKAKYKKALARFSHFIPNLYFLYKNPLTRYIKNILTSQIMSFKYKDIKIYENVSLSYSAFGKNICLYPNVKLHNVRLGDFSYIANNTRIANANIGKFCSIAPDCVIGLGIHPSRDFISTHPAFYSTAKQANISFVKENRFQEHIPINIGNDVWIGQGVIIKDGVNIGDGVIIGAGSVVTKDLLAYGIYAGVPARLVRFRFDNDTIKILQNLKWWDLPLNDLKLYAPYFNDATSLKKLLEYIDKLPMGGGDKLKYHLQTHLLKPPLNNPKTPLHLNYTSIKEAV